MGCGCRGRRWRDRYTPGRAGWQHASAGIVFLDGEPPFLCKQSEGSIPRFPSTLLSFSFLDDAGDFFSVSAGISAVAVAVAITFAVVITAEEMTGRFVALTSDGCVRPRGGKPMQLALLDDGEDGVEEFVFLRLYDSYGICFSFISLGWHVRFDIRGVRSKGIALQPQQESE